MMASVAAVRKTGASEAVIPTVRALKTKAESALAERFSALEEGLPGSAAVKRLRREAFARFEALGLPHRRVEAWKYTDLRSLLKDAPEFASGTPSPEFATALASSSGWVLDELSALAAADDDGVVALNTALMSDGTIIDIAAGMQRAEPLVIASGLSGTVRNIIRIGSQARVTLIEEAGSGDLNTLTQLSIGDGAEVTHLKLTDTAAGRVHLGHWVVRLGADATYRPIQLSSGDGITRNGLTVRFDGPRSQLDFAAGALGLADSHSDTTMVIDHAVPHCTSRELFKTVLAGDARAVFQGKVIVRPGAQKTDGKQMAKALMLSPTAEFDAKPELEIYADDVVCGHGATSMELDEDHLFYLMSRGIPAASARRMLTQAFVAEVIDKVADAAIAERLQWAIAAWFKRLG